MAVSSFPSEDGSSAIFHLREISGKRAKLNLKSGISGLTLNTIQVDVLGEEIGSGDNILNPWETKFFKLELR